MGNSPRPLAWPWTGAETCLSPTRATTASRSSPAREDWERAELFGRGLRNKHLNRASRPLGNPPLCSGSQRGRAMTPPDDRAASADYTGYGHSVGDRKSTRLNSSHQIISYAVFCLKKKKKNKVKSTE